MDPVHPSELPPSLSLLPGYSSLVPNKNLWLLVFIQLALCVVSTVYLSYYLYRNLFLIGGKSWKESMDVMRPMGKRIQNLEKERLIWESYLEWVEDYCTVYYGLLNYLNSAVTDLDKVYREHELVFNHPSESTCSTKSTKHEDGGQEAKFIRDFSWDKVTLNEDLELAEKINRVLMGAKFANTYKSGSGDVKRDDMDSLSGFSGLTESFRDELESYKGSEDEGSCEVKVAS